MLDFLRNVIVFDKSSLENTEKIFDNSMAESDYSGTEKEDDVLEDMQDDAPLGKCGSSKLFMEEFIECYGQYPLLWDPNNPKYRFRSLRGEAYTKLLKIMKHHYSRDCSFDDVRKKIHNIRTVYRREETKILADPNYVSTIWWFPLVSFLSQSSRKESSLDNIRTGSTDSNVRTIESAVPETSKRCINPKEFLREFIKCYGDNSVLWQKDHPQYRCRSTKKAAYIKLKQIYKKYYNKDCSYDDIRKRIHSIRKAYRRESVRELDDGDKSKLWWYDLAEFLNNSRSSGKNTEKEEITTEDVPIKIIKEQHFINDKSEMESKMGNSVENILPIEELICEVESDNVIERKRQKIKLSHEDKMLLKYYEQKQEQDTYDKMSKIWTDKIRKMNKLQRQYAAQAINEIVFKGELNKLDYDFVQKLSSYVN